MKSDVTRQMKQDLIHSFNNIGVSISDDDIPTIMRLGADRYLNQIRFSTTEECMSSIYIILHEMREHKNQKL